MRGDPRLEFLLGQVLRVEARAGGVLETADERLPGFLPVERAGHEVEVLPRRSLVPGRPVLDLLPQLDVPGPRLAQEDLVHQLRGLHQLVEHLAVLGRERGGVRFERRGGELGEALGDVGRDLQIRFLPGRLGGHRSPGSGTEKRRHTEGENLGMHRVSFHAAPMVAHRSQEVQPRIGEDPAMTRVKPYEPEVNYWLLQTEPDQYSWDDLERDSSTVWNGVTDYEALKNLRDIDEGDMALICHKGDEPAIVGIVQVRSDAYPDPEGNDSTQWVVDVELVGRLPRPIRLDEILDDPELQDFPLVDEPDLDVV